MNLFFRAKILGTQGCGGDQEGNRIEQIVAIELPNNIKLGVYDGVVMRVAPDMIGKEMELALLVLVGIGGLTIVPGTDKKIQPSNEKYLDFPYHYSNHIYFGKVEEVGVKDIWHGPLMYTRLIYIDVGVCHILANLDMETFKGVREGLYVKLEKTQTEFLDIR
jgi:hypothetical protein